LQRRSRRQRIHDLGPAGEVHRSPIDEKKVEGADVVRQAFGGPLQLPHLDIGQRIRRRRRRGKHVDDGAIAIIGGIAVAADPRGEQALDDDRIGNAGDGQAAIGLQHADGILRVDVEHAVDRTDRIAEGVLRTRSRARMTAGSLGSSLGRKVSSMQFSTGPTRPTGSSTSMVSCTDSPGASVMNS
jgi:hypothetical protein